MKAARGTKMGQPSVQPFSGSMRRGKGESTHRIQDETLCSLSDLLHFTPLMCSTPLHPTFHKLINVRLILQGAEAHRSEGKSREQNWVPRRLFEANLPCLPYFYLHSPCFILHHKTVRSSSFSYLDCYSTALTMETWMYPHFKELNRTLKWLSSHLIPFIQKPWL